jgi:uncharacterized membrane protein YfcA
MLVLTIVLALLVGLSLGLLGGGGSILTVPILRYVLGMDAHEAIALSLLVVGTTSLAALVPHARKRRVRWRTGLIFGLAGMAGAFAAGRVAHLIPAEILLTAFGIMMFVTAFAMLRPKRSCTGPVAAQDSTHELPIAKVLAEGVVVGAVTGLVGAGGGFLVVPALVLLGGLPMELAVGTSLVVIAMKSLAGFAGFIGHTQVDWALGLSISASAVVGSIAGGLLVSRIPASALRAVFGWFVIAMAFFILAQEVPGLIGREPSLPLALLISAVGTTFFAAIRRAAQSVRKSSSKNGPSAPSASAPNVLRSQSVPPGA